MFCAELPSVGGIVLVRMELDFEPKDGNPNDIAFTAVQYVPRGAANCQNPGSIINPNILSPQTADRPTIPNAKYDPGTNHLTGTLCQENLNFGGTELPGWSQIDIDFNFTDPPGKTADVDAFVLGLGGDAETCDGATGLAIEINEGLWLDGPGGDPTTFSSNWDGGGRSDWAELTFASVGRGDPFDPSDDATGGVGGIAEIDETAGAPLGAEASSSGTGAWLIAGVAAAAVAGATVFGGAAIFARRRIDR